MSSPGDTPPVLPEWTKKGIAEQPEELNVEPIRAVRGRSGSVDIGSSAKGHGHRRSGSIPNIGSFARKMVDNTVGSLTPRGSRRRGKSQTASTKNSSLLRSSSSDFPEGGRSRSNSRIGSAPILENPVVFTPTDASLLHAVDYHVIRKKVFSQIEGILLGLAQTKGDILSPASIHNKKYIAQVNEDMSYHVETLRDYCIAASIDEDDPSKYNCESIPGSQNAAPVQSGCDSPTLTGSVVPNERRGALIAIRIVANALVCMKMYLSLFSNDTAVYLHDVLRIVGDCIDNPGIAGQLVANVPLPADIVRSDLSAIVRRSARNRMRQNMRVRVIELFSNRDDGIRYMSGPLRYSKKKKSPPDAKKRPCDVVLTRKALYIRKGDADPDTSADNYGSVPGLSDGTRHPFNVSSGNVDVYPLSTVGLVRPFLSEDDLAGGASAVDSPCASPTNSPGPRRRAVTTSTVPTLAGSSSSGNIAAKPDATAFVVEVGGGKNIYLAADTLKQSNRWIMALGGLLNHNNNLALVPQVSVNRITNISQHKGGCVKSSFDEEWSYFKNGTLRNDLGSSKEKYRWNGTTLLALSGDTVGSGVWNGAWLAWYSRGKDAVSARDVLYDFERTPRYLYLYDPATREYHSPDNTRTWKWTRHFLANKTGSGEWIVEGDVPEAVVFFLQMQRYARHDLPEVLEVEDEVNDGLAEAMAETLPATAPELPAMSVPSAVAPPELPPDIPNLPGNIEIAPNGSVRTKKEKGDTLSWLDFVGETEASAPKARGKEEDPPPLPPATAAAIAPNSLTDCAPPPLPSNSTPPLMRANTSPLSMSVDSSAGNSGDKDKYPRSEASCLRDTVPS
eukprot:TRINITY_DN14783_c0_g1_i1.p1 TRINITY_DN14783_c0_g1~~TRINITY_DN14783_c0_g1_i1.p1  ORF type:complete len:900 (-),score=139.36 TRINITY_DN14783_c0_g1_i1:52-2583(-)